jgi:hypothetical protein
VRRFNAKPGLKNGTATVIDRNSVGLPAEPLMADDEALIELLREIVRFQALFAALYCRLQIPGRLPISDQRLNAAYIF